MTSQGKVNGSIDFIIKSQLAENRVSPSLLVEHHCHHGSHKKARFGSFLGSTMIYCTIPFQIHLNDDNFARNCMVCAASLRSLQLSTESSTSIKSFTSLGSLGKERVAGNLWWYLFRVFWGVFSVMSIFSKACPCRWSIVSGGWTAGKQNFLLWNGGPTTMWHKWCITRSPLLVQQERRQQHQFSIVPPFHFLIHPISPLLSQTSFVFSLFWSCSSRWFSKLQGLLWLPASHLTCCYSEADRKTERALNLTSRKHVEAPESLCMFVHFSLLQPQLAHNSCRSSRRLCFVNVTTRAVPL